MKIVNIYICCFSEIFSTKLENYGFSSLYCEKVCPFLIKFISLSCFYSTCVYVFIAKFLLRDEDKRLMQVVVVALRNL